MNADELAAHFQGMLPDTQVLPVERLCQDLTLGCVDGRNPGCVAGAPGGNAGLLVLLLASLEAVTGRALGDAEVKTLFGRYLGHFGHFYLHSDHLAMRELGRALPPGLLTAAGGPAQGDAAGVEALVRRPPEALRGELLDLLVEPAHVGCGHLRLLLSEPEVYQARAELTAGVLRAFFQALWEGDDRLIFEVLPGDHHEEAVVQVHAGAQELLVACPHYGASEFFVLHPDAVAWMEALQARYAVEEGWIAEDEAPDLMQAQVRLGEVQLQATLERLAAGLPVFEIHLEVNGDPTPELPRPVRLRVTPSGVVPACAPAAPTGRETTPV